MVSPEIAGLREMASAAAEDPDTARARVRVFAALMGDEPAARIGRYTLLHRLGTGGMGVVWAAFDPELDRTIALKVLHHAPGDSGTRLLREARAMGKLNHPNVAAIYEVGVDAGELYLAMELVRGETLERWLEVNRGTCRPGDVLEVYVQAGRGLAAAHALGIVHRDFKPANAIVGGDPQRAGAIGRVRVVDFGLARKSDAAEVLSTGDDDPSGSAREHCDALKTAVSRSDLVVGTPAYMAPEQLLGRPTDARTDQFAFCTALWEALFGEHPFAAPTLDELFANLRAGKLRECSRPRGVPPDVVDALRRGLALNPDDRHPSMDVLLEHIERSGSRARRRQAFVAVAAVGVLAAAAWSWARLAEAGRKAECERHGDAIASLWNEDREAALRSAFAATGLPYAAGSAERAIPWLVAQADALRGAGTEACVAASIASDAETFERAAWCLEDRREELEATLARLAVADEVTVLAAVALAAGPESIAPCRDDEVLARLVLPPPEGREAVRAIHRELATSSVSRRVGRVEDAIAGVPDLVARADATGWAPVAAAARLEGGLILATAWQHEDAEAMLVDAYFAGVNGGAPEIAAGAATELAWTVGNMLGRPADGLTWGRHAEAVLDELGESDGPRRARLLEHQCVVARVASPSTVARDVCARALAATQVTFGGEHPYVARPLDLLASVEADLGNHAIARELNERTLRIAELAYGREHPQYGIALGSRAEMFARLGQHADAVEVMRKALAIDEAAFGTATIKLFPVLENLAFHQRFAGDCAGAAITQRRLLEVFDASGSRDARLRGLVIGGLAGHESCNGDDEEAVTLQRTAVELLGEGLGENSSAVAQATISLGTYQRATGRLADARRTLEHGLRILDGLGGADDLAAGPTLQLAEIALDEGRRADALRLATRAVTLAKRPRQRRDWLEPQEALIAESRFVLARAHWAEGDREVAVGVALAARDGYALVDGSARERDTVESWLRQHATALRKTLARSR